MYTQTYTQMFTASLFVIPQKWKQSKYLLTGELSNKMWYIYKVEYYSAITRNKLVTHAATDEPQKHDAKGNNPNANGSLLYDPIYMEGPEKASL